jgi:hypothetical protein
MQIANNFLKKRRYLNAVWGTIFLVLIYLWDLLLDSFIPESQRYIFIFIPSLTVLTYASIFFLKSKKNDLSSILDNKLNLLCLMSLVFGITLNFSRSDTSAILQTGLFWTSILAYQLFASKYIIRGYAFLLVLILLIFPYVITSNNYIDIQFLFPSEVNNWKAFVISTHFSSVLGGVLLLFGFFNLFKRGRSISDFVIILLGIYLVVFAQSRTTLLATIFSLALGVFMKNVKKVFLLLLSLSLILSIYLVTPIIQQNTSLLGSLGNSSFTRTFLKIDNAKTSSGISSGREWLWKYHIVLFNQYMWTGAPRSLLDFKAGDVINGERATAGSESFFTYVLARYGIWGISYYIFFVMLLWKSIKSGEQEYYALVLYSIINCGGISLLGNPYGANNMAIYLYIFSLSHQAEMRAKINKILLSR